MNERDLTSADLARKIREQAQATGGVTVNEVTIRRLMKAEALTDAKPETMAAVAAGLGMAVEELFPDSATAVVEIGGRRYALKALDGEPVSERDLDRVRGLSVEGAQSVHDAKARLRAGAHKPAKRKTRA